MPRDILTEPAGHSGQTKVFDGSYDDAIYPVDFREVGHIVNDEMHRIMVTALYPGVHLTIIVDSCHSNNDSGSCSAELLNSQAVKSNIMNLSLPLLPPPLSYQTPTSEKDYGDSNSLLGQTQALNLPFPLSPFHTTTTTGGQPSQLRDALPKICEQIMPSGKRCNVEFSRIRDLIRHKNTIHNALRKMVPCKFCTRSYTRKDALRRHVRKCTTSGVASVT
jgi:hypothetical protein